MKNVWMMGAPALFGLLGCMGAGETVGRSASALVLDVDVSLTAADGGEDDGTILWEILNVTEGGQEDGGEEDGTILWEILEAADGGEEDGTILWEIVETTDGGEDDGTILWEILDAESGREVCEVEGGVLVDVLTGRRLLEARSDGVYAVGGRVPSYVFSGDQVLRGDGTLLLTTDPAQAGASDGRKLIIAALVDGHCGSAGMP